MTYPTELYKRNKIEPLANLSFWPKGCHSGQAKRDPESRFIKHFWIPAFAGMTAWGTFARASIVTIHTASRVSRGQP